MPPNQLNLSSVFSGAKFTLNDTDSAIEQYRSIGALPQPSARQRRLVYDFTHSKSLDGDCGFISADLADEPPFGPSLYAGPSSRDLAFLGGDDSQDDLLSEFLIGPVLRMFHVLWKTMKVCEPLLFLVDWAGAVRYLTLHLDRNPLPAMTGLPRPCGTTRTLT